MNANHLVERIFFLSESLLKEDVPWESLNDRLSYKLENALYSLNSPSQSNISDCSWLIWDAFHIFFYWFDEANQILWNTADPVTNSYNSACFFQTIVPKYHNLPFCKIKSKTGSHHEQRFPSPEKVIELFNDLINYVNSI